jgi:hypothetical protein
LTNGIVNTGTHTLTLGVNATSSRDGSCALTNCFVASSPTAGGLSKLFNAGMTANFTFHVGTTGGTDNGYTPVALANITANAAGDGLTVRAVDTVSPASISTPKITRYWELTEIGALTTDLTFTYLDADDAPIVDATRLSVFRNTASVCSSDCVNEVAFTGTVPGVTDFSPWTVAQIVPTAAAVSIGGQVITAQGNSISGARVSIINANGETRYALTNPFGYYRFAGVPSGEIYILNVSHKQYRFSQPNRVINLTEELDNVDFTSEP